VTNAATADLWRTLEDARTMEETVNPETKRTVDLAMRPWKRIGRPSKRGRKFVENVVIKRMSDKDAALAAGFSLSTAKNTRQKLWNQKGVKAHFQEIVQDVLPPDRVRKVYNELLEGRSTSTRLKRERLKDAQGNPLLDKDGKVRWQVVSATEIETVDRRVQLQALEMAVRHAGLVPQSIRLQPICNVDTAKPPEAESEPLNCRGAGGALRCAHGRCLACETCEECEGAGLELASA